MTDLLLGLIAPMWHISHSRHARAFMSVVVALTGVWMILYEFLRTHAPAMYLQDYSDQVLLRGYVFSVALCLLVEHVLSLRDEEQAIPVVTLALSSAFCSPYRLRYGLSHCSRPKENMYDYSQYRHDHNDRPGHP